jgi:thiol-disulfide isomerase/thioredoxin
MKYFSIALLLILCGCYGRKPIKTGLEGQAMPEINLVGLDSSTQFTTKEIAEGKTTILFSFEPWCPYCKAQTEEMVSEMKKFKQVNIYMLSSSHFSLLNDFYSHFKLASFPNVKVFVDSTKELRKYFNDYRIPYTAIYGPDKKLRQAFVGKTNVNLIAEAAE